MKEMKDKSSVILSIFRRKGGEGIQTKIIHNENKSYFSNQIAILKENENALLCFKQDDSNWLLITNTRIVQERDRVRLSIPYSELLEVNPALQNEFQNGVMSKSDFTKLNLKCSDGNKYIIELEKGEPYQGIYQLLHYVASNNRGQLKC